MDLNKLLEDEKPKHFSTQVMSQSQNVLKVSRNYSGRIKPYVDANLNKMPELSKISRHYKKSIIRQSVRQQNNIRKKSVQSRTSSFVTEVGNRIQQEKDKNRTSQDSYQLVLEQVAEPKKISEDFERFNSITGYPQSQQNKSRVNQITQFIEDDDLNGFVLWKVTRAEMLSMRFQFNQNILQLVCHEEAIQIFQYITAELTNEQELKKEMATHRDAHLGSQAIHLAATTGNRSIIDTLIKDYKADFQQLTQGKQTVHHIAAQKNDGIVSIHFFRQIDVNLKDKKGATALHFATISLQLKNVQALIKLGADPNAQDLEGNTPLHLCLKLLCEDETRNFETLKNIGKELLFSGASRSIQNNQEQFPKDLLELNKELLDDFDYKKMQYVLSEPQGCSVLKMTRPIEKVQRRNTLQIFVLVFDISNFILFGVTACFEINQQFEDQSVFHALFSFAILTAVAFFCTVIFYVLTLMDPGYVEKQTNFQQLIEKIVSERYHLDYVCVYCENLRPEMSDHCNFCNRCVQKFDHHCVFVNNCLGYKNHKWFLCFLLSFTVFMILFFTRSVIGIIAVSEVFQTNKAANSFKIFLDIYFIIVCLLHSPIVYLQLRSQISKLFKNPIQSDVVSQADDQNTNFERSRSDSVILQQQQSSPFIQNLKSVFKFQPQTQDYLYSQLFGETLNQDEIKQSQRLNTLQVVIEEQSYESGRYRTNSHGSLLKTFKEDVIYQKTEQRRNSAVFSIHDSGYDSDHLSTPGMNSKTNTKDQNSSQREDSVEQQLESLSSNYRLPKVQDINLRLNASLSKEI